jgi:hypothetical protein
MSRIRLSENMVEKLWNHYADCRLSQESTARWQRASSVLSILSILKYYQSMGWDLQFGPPGDLSYSISEQQAPFFFLTYSN